MRELDERPHDGVGSAAATRVVEEHRVDLHLVERQHADRRDGGGAPEIVEREANAELAKPLHDEPVELGARAGPRRNDLERQSLRRDVVRLEQLGQPDDELRVVDQPIRDVDRDAEGMPDCLPFLEPAERVVRDGERQRPDERRLLDVRDELRRSDEPIRMRTPDERLDAAHGSRAEIDDRLVVDDDLTPLERALEIADDAPVDRTAAGDRRLLARVALRRVHLAVGPREEVDPARARPGGTAPIRSTRRARRGRPRRGTAA